MVEGQCWGGGIFNLGLVQPDPREAGGFYTESGRGAHFGEMLSSTWVSSHRRTHSQWRWQSPPSTWVMVPSLLCMEALLTCHSSWLPSFHAPVGGTAAKTGLPLCSPRVSGAETWIPLVLPSQVLCGPFSLCWHGPPPQKPYRNFWTRSSQQSLLSPMSSHGEKTESPLTRSILRLAALIPSPHIPWPSFHINKSGATRVRMESGWKRAGWFCSLCSNYIVIARMHGFCSWAVLFKIVFWCGPFFNCLLNLLQYRFFSVSFFGCKICGVLAPWSTFGIEPTFPAWEGLSRQTTWEVPGQHCIEWGVPQCFLSAALAWTLFTILGQKATPSLHHLLQMYKSGSSTVFLW